MRPFTIRLGRSLRFVNRWSGPLPAHHWFFQATVYLGFGMATPSISVPAFKGIGKSNVCLLWGFDSATRPGLRRQSFSRRYCSLYPGYDPRPFVQGHLLGRRIVGVYPLLEDETCWFLAIDFGIDLLAAAKQAPEECDLHRLRRMRIHSADGRWSVYRLGCGR